MATLNLVLDNVSYTLHSRFAPAQISQTLVVGKQIKNKAYEGKIAYFDQTPNKDVVVKWSTNLKDIEGLDREYKFYSVDLLQLQGKSVPMCFGLFKGDTEIGPMACLILEKCISCSGVVDALKEKTEFYRQFMLNLCQIHAAGVQHNRLDKPGHIMQEGPCPRIIDFSKATRHKCPGSVPADQFGQVHSTRENCPELVVLEVLYGMKSGKRQNDPIGSITHAFSKMWAP